MAPSLPAKASWRPDIEGLRGLAVLLVVCFHAGLPMLRGAFVAVDVFFVLSGFFLTTTLARQIVSDDGLNLEDVYARRVWRLLPAMVVVLLATMLSVMFLYAPIDRAAVADYLQPVAFFAGNLAFASEGVNYFSAAENPLLHTWTLGVEYQLVLLFPALVAGLAWFGRKRAAGVETIDARRLIVMRTVLGGIAAVGAASFLVSIAFSASAPMWAYFGPHTRLWAFAVGAAAALLVGGGQSLLGASTLRVGVAQGVGLLAIFVPSMLYDRSMPYPGMVTLAPVGGALLLLAGGAISSETLIGRALSSPALTWLGRVSYPWYLWHWPLMVLGGVLIPGLGAWGRLACGLLGLSLAVLTQRYIERPANKYLWPQMRWTSPFMVAIGISMAVFVVGYTMSARSQRYVESTVHRTYAAARGDRMQHPCWVRSIDESKKQACGFGAPTGTTLALLGDSHAEHWLGGLERAGREHGWRIDVNVMGGCPVSDFSSLISGTSARRYRECSRYREAMLTRIVAQRPRAVILSSFDAYMAIEGGDQHESQVSEDAWTEGLRLTYARFDKAGIPVIAIRGTPRVPFDVPSCLSRREDRLPFATDCTYTLDRAFVSRARQAQDVAARGLNVRFVDMMDQLCTATRCPTMRGGVVMFTDNNHLTASFSKSLGGVLGERLVGALDRENADPGVLERGPCGFNLPGISSWVRDMIVAGRPTRLCIQPTGT